MEKSLLKSQNYLKRFDFDKNFRTQYGIICGIDEAGRGPLAGDVFAAAVILSDDVMIEGLDDSKKLTEKKRDSLYDEIREKAIAYSIANASVEEIEELNILQATMLAMQRAFVGLNTECHLALIDGNKAPILSAETLTVIKGDSLSASIAAASILAKVARDRQMMAMDVLFPQYHFSQHKGYGTQLHKQALLEYGPCEIHRKKFVNTIMGRS